MVCIRKLDNGIRLVMEKMEHISSVSIGVIVEIGSRDEDLDNNGISHFIEHMLFRGTSTKTAKEISKSIDAIGGNLNAFTSKENTCFYAQVLSPHLEMAIELLSDMFLNSLFLKEDINKEKNIIEEEINMYLDDYEDRSHELLNELIYSNSSLSLPILGSKDSISSFDGSIIKGFFESKYTSERIIISISGNFNLEETYKVINKSFNKIPYKKPTHEGINIINEKSKYKRIKGISKEIEQFNLCIGLPGVSSKSESIYSYMLLNNIIGNSESSRLYQSIREKGLSYSLYSNLTSYRDKGDISIYIGSNNGQIKEVINLLKKEFDNLRSYSITREELERVKEQLKINYILDSESSASRMFENARNISLFGENISDKQVLKKIDHVSKDDISSLIDKILKNEYRNVSYIGDIENRTTLEEYIKNKLLL